MLRTYLVLVAALGTAGSAMASFELALLYDATSMQIIRYDPVNNVTLGSFGRQYQGAYSNAHLLSLDPLNPGSVLTQDVTGTVRRLNYSTGILEEMYNPSSALSFATRFVALRDGNYISGFSDGAFRVYSRSSTAPLYSFPVYSNYTTLDVVPLANGEFLTLERFSAGGGNYTTSVFRRDSSGFFLTGLFSLFPSTSTGALTRLALSGDKLLLTGGPSGNLNLAGVRFDGSSFTATGGYNYSAFLDTTSISNSLVGHGGGMYFFQNNATLSRMYTVDPFGQNAYSYSTLNGISVHNAVIVVAPEPMTMTALGIGLAALVRRRRKRA